MWCPYKANQDAAKRVEELYHAQVVKAAGHYAPCLLFQKRMKTCCVHDGSNSNMVITKYEKGDINGASHSSEARPPASAIFASRLLQLLYIHAEADIRDGEALQRQIDHIHL